MATTTTPATSTTASPVEEDLAALKHEIAALGDKIKDLKSSSPADQNKDDIAAAIDDMLSKKKLYAERNGGIGVDGKPYEAPLSKAEKKAKAKAEKAAAAAAAASGGGGGDGDQPSAGPARPVRSSSLSFTF